MCYDKKCVCVGGGGGGGGEKKDQDNLVFMIPTILSVLNKLLTYNRFSHQVVLQFCADALNSGQRGPLPM